jgi:hypothetical protein
MPVLEALPYCGDKLIHKRRATGPLVARMVQGCAPYHVCTPKSTLVEKWQTGYFNKLLNLLKFAGLAQR